MNSSTCFQKMCSFCFHVSLASSRPHSQNPSGRARTPTFIPHPTCGKSTFFSSCPERSASLCCIFTSHHRLPGSTQRRRSPRPQVDCDVISPGVDEDDLVPHGYKLQDLTDVQVIARLQEESRSKLKFTSNSIFLNVCD